MFQTIKQLFWPQPVAPRLYIPDEQVYLTLATIHKRSSKWSTKRDRFISLHPFCAVCGNRENLTVHHIQPYHLFPELELEDSNLIVLCEGPVVNCHFLFGHVRNWRSYNPEVVKLAAAWQRALQEAEPGRPVIIAA